MSNSRYDPVWMVMENYNLEYTDFVDSAFECTLCKKLMKNAYSNFCGCRYCFKCITNFINAGNTCCPGPSSDCKDSEINLLNNIQIDHVINKKIINLNVKCPFDLCDFKGELLAFVEHEEFHTNQLKSFEHIDKENIYEFVDHCDKQTVNRKNLNQAKTDIDSNSTDFSNVPTISELQSIIRGHNNYIKDLGSAIDAIIHELNKLKIENKKINDFILQKPITKEIDSQQLKNNEKIERKKSKKPIKNEEEIKNNELPKPPVVVLRWALNNFSKKRNSAKTGKKTCIFSRAFYAFKNGYRFCLCAWPNGIGEAVDKFLSVGVCLVKGKYDKKLIWPMKHKLSLCFVNQSTNKIHLQSDYCYERANEIEKERYMRPSEKNATIGTLRFVNFDILYNEQFYVKNRIVLEFCLNLES